MRGGTKYDDVVVQGDFQQDRPWQHASGQDTNTSSCVASDGILKQIGAQASPECCTNPECERDEIQW